MSSVWKDPANWLNEVEPADWACLTPQERRELDSLLPPPPMWKPLPGPQTAAFHSKADELFYGGAAGGGKSDLLIGIAGTSHRQSVIFRREFPRLRAMIERSREVYNREGATHLKDSYNESLHVWRLHDGRMVEFAACQFEKDKENQRGRPRDLYGFDELTEFTESQYRFVTAWNRSTVPGQRCRIVATSNPPTSSEGEWVIRYWGPWLDSRHPNPARPGELRWFARIDDEDVEVGGPDVVVHKGQRIKPRSRSFIPALLKDNPILEATGYGAVLAALPEPLRSQMLYGDFSVGVGDDIWQVIPTAWIRAAMERWHEGAPPGHPLSCIGADISRGGADQTVAAPRYGPWFARMKAIKGVETDDGPKAAKFILRLHDGRSPVNFDVIGIGSSAYDAARLIIGDMAVAVNVAEATNMTDRSGMFRMVNIRAAMYWKMREALDPENGQGLMLPPDPELLADLCAARFEVRANGIILEPKDKCKERTGRSPDKGDAACLSLWEGGGIVPRALVISGETREAKADSMAGEEGIEWEPWGER